MFWLYYIPTVWEEDLKSLYQDIYLFNYEEDRDINEESIWLTVNSIQNDINNINHIINELKKNLSQGIKHSVLKLNMYDTDGNFKSTKYVKINNQKNLDKYKVKLKDVNKLRKKIQENDGYLIDYKKEFTITVDGYFNCH